MAARFFVSKLDTFPGGVCSRAKRSGAVRRFLALLEPSPCAEGDVALPAERWGEAGRLSGGFRPCGNMSAFSGIRSLCDFPLFFPFNGSINRTGIGGAHTQTIAPQSFQIL